MADFRRWFYALAMVALLAGFTVPAFAQQVPFTCNTNAGVPPIVRAEAYADLVGDLVLNCTGGTPTIAGNPVPQVNITIFLSTNITSKLVGTAAGNFDEALLIMDEPNAVGPNSNRPILNCGNSTGDPDNGPSGPGVCSIVSNGNPQQTYDGTLGMQGLTPCDGTGTDPAAGSYACGRPNVFQGRLGLQQNSGQSNIVVFLGVPLDPPGTGTTRTLRITNVRADAEFVGVASTFQQLPIQMQISVNGNTSLLINNPQQVVAFVQRGLVASVNNPRLDFAQCNSENPDGQGFNNPQPFLRFQEGFASSWKEKNIAQHLANSTFTSNAYTYTDGSILYPSDLNQNVPGALYNTESGFEYQPPPIANPNPNPPPGIGNGTVTGYLTGYPFTSISGTGIETAGVATQGTRLAMSFSNIPQGSAVYVVPVVFLYRQGDVPTNHTGVAVLTATDANGDSAYAPVGGGGHIQVSNGLAVYEVLYDDPFSLEQVDIPIIVSFTSNLSANPPIGLPVTGVIAQVTGGFAPFYSTAAARQPQYTSAYPVPRFVPGNQGPNNVFEINKCACDLLFPFVTNLGSVPGSVYDTGIAIANTSLDPGATFGFFATPQQGAVQFWYYGVGANGSAPPPSQTSGIVPAGQVLTYVLSSGGGAIGTSPNGLDNRGAGFQGYIIAQAAFQYCHAYAFINAAGSLASSPGVSEGYLGIVLDTPWNTGGRALPRTTQVGENDAH